MLEGVLPAMMITEGEANLQILKDDLDLNYLLVK